METSKYYKVVERILYQPFRVGTIVFEGNKKQAWAECKRLYKQVGSPHNSFHSDYFVVVSHKLTIGDTWKR